VSVKSAKYIIMQTKPRGSSRPLLFAVKDLGVEFQLFTPNEGAKYTWSIKIATFDK